MFNLRNSLLSFFSVLSILSVNAQQFDDTADVKKDKLNVKIESAGVLSNGDFAPFWLINNNYGIGSYKTDNGYMRAGVFSSKNLFNNQLNVSIGGDALIAHNLESDIFVQQLFADFKYKSLALSIGQKERRNFFRNQELSTGGMTTSINTRPMPQAEFSMPHFTTIPFTKNTLQVLGGFSFGKFMDNDYRVNNAGDGNYSKNVLYHHKHLFLKIEKPESAWNLILGLEMGAQWGGDRYRDGKYDSTNPHGASDYFRILLNQSGGGNAHQADKDNKLGDSFGSYHVIYNHKLNDSNLKLYYEHFFEDRSGMEYMNFPDGTYGFELDFKKKQLVSTIVFEYIYTRNQSGLFERDENGNVKVDENGNIIMKPLSAEDNYYNNGLYTSFQHHGFVMGNPLLTSPLYNKGTTLKIANNQISAFHGGISGYFTNNISYKALATYSRVYGVPRVIRDGKNQFSGLVELSYTNENLAGWRFSGALACDRAKDVVGNNLGFQLKISKLFDIK